jgi:pentatricopeptide repeat protein
VEDLIVQMSQLQNDRKTRRGEFCVVFYAIFSHLWTQQPWTVVTHYTANAAFLSYPNHQRYPTSKASDSLLKFDRKRQTTFCLYTSPSTSSPSSITSKPKKPLSISDYAPATDSKAIEREMGRLSRSGRVQDALSLYWSIWEKDESHVSKNPQIKPTTKLMNHAIDACARCRPSPLLSDAFHIFEHGIVGGKSGHRRLCPNVYTFGALISVCARVGDVHKCSDLLKSMRV